MILSDLLLARVLNQRTFDRFSHNRDHATAIRQDSKIIRKDASAVEKGKRSTVGLFGKGVEFLDRWGLLGLVK
jgi:hypothetical protein